MACEYCGSSYDVAEIEALYADKEEKARAGPAVPLWTVTAPAAAVAGISEPLPDDIMK